MIERDSTNTTSILEIGCGDGKSLSDLYGLTCGKFKYVGIDYSERAISFAKAFNYGKDISFYHQYADKINFDYSYDVVILRDVIEHLDDDTLENTLKSISINSNKSQRLILTVPSINDPLIDKHYRHYTSDELVNQVEKHGYSLVELIGYIYQPRWLYPVLFNLVKFPLIWRVYRLFMVNVNPSNCKILIAQFVKNNDNQK